MGMQNPVVNDPIDKLSEVIAEGSPFTIDGLRIVSAKTADFGDGEMVIVKVRGHERECGVWGSYLLAQARSADASDYGKQYVLNRRVIEGFGKGRPVKVFDPYSAPVQSTIADGTAA
jgi:hypothetical protein